MKTFVVENGVQATETIENLENQGVKRDDIYLFAHDSNRSDHLTEGTHTKNVGLKEEGIFDKMANSLRSRGDELRSKMESLGVTQGEAARLEEELDYGKVVIVAKDY
ncbi:general stress protein [Metabacillus herbersteinensis]|uniref:General stress protein n=1 Tax=Metabacillus herbersteinensis TaxID=283816 RepID=A0ABV6GFE5_9BACI